MAPINYLIIEDEYYTALELRETMRSLRPGYHLADIVEDIVGTVDFLSSHSVDLILSDITLADGSVFEALKRVGGRTPVIFITAFKKYKPLTEPFNTVAFLLKPVAEEALASALDAFEGSDGRQHKQQAYQSIHIKEN